MEKQKLVLIDTFNFLHRAYHALPNTLSDSEGSPTNAVYGVTSMLISFFDALQPNYVVAANESKTPLKRFLEWEEYKAHRKPMDEDLKVQIPKVFEVMSAFGIRQIDVDGYEADDIIGTLSRKHGIDNVEVVIVSNDRDLWQLVNDNVFIMMPVNGGNIEWIGKEEVEKRLGFTAAQVIDYKALRGDPSDNIPGVKGIGEKTAKKLIKEFGTLDGVYAHLDHVSPESVKNKLSNGKENAFISKRLATIDTGVPVNLELEDCRYLEFNKGRVKDVLQKYNFKSLIRRLGFEVSSKAQEKPPENQMTLL